MRAILAVCALALALATPGRPALAETYLIDQEVWSWYQEYLRAIGNGRRPGAFAISKDGRSAFYTWCREFRCMAGPGYGQTALNSCVREYGEQCVVFAVRDDIRVDYEIRGGADNAYSPAAPAPVAPAPVTPATVAPATVAPAKTPPAATTHPPDASGDAAAPVAVASAEPPAPAAAPVVPPKPALKIAVTPDVQEKIDIYLRNVRSAGRVWAFALSRDGTEGAMASCPVGSTYAGGRSCYPVLGSMEELAQRAALARCGAPGACVLLYVGQQKQGNFEIVMR